MIEYFSGWAKLAVNHLIGKTVREVDVTFLLHILQAVLPSPNDRVLEATVPHDITSWSDARTALYAPLSNLRW